MKAYKYITLVLGMTLLGACELTPNVDEVDPLFVLDSNTVITDPTSAELALNGVYNSYYSGGRFMQHMSPLSSMMGLTVVAAAGNPTPYYARNEVIPNDQFAAQIYAGIYSLINRANWVIDKVGTLSDQGFVGKRRTEIVGEAKFNRALGHFYLLRSFGQFWDKNSPFGITNKKTPSTSAEILQRNSVQDVYNFILQDLNEAIAEAPAFRQHYYASSVAAKALKAKVQLYNQDFAGAAETAKQIIDDNTDQYELVPTFQEIFAPIPASYNSKETLFSVATTASDQSSTVGMDEVYFFFSLYALSPYYIGLGQQKVTIDNKEVKLDNSRVLFTNASHCFVPNVPSACFPMNGKFPFPQGVTKSTYSHMRMAELYLIYAEAELRRGGSIANALDALNKVRARAKADLYPTTITSAELMEAIRIEKILELGAENGEDWFDLIRYEILDPNFKISTHKPTLQESTGAGGTQKYVLPYPRSSVDAGLAQNPGY